uniref:ECF transporter S component n=1 Tax=Ignisphaera aggregans TaxID=334771 RepID=A0A7J2TAD9_9CREN
MTKASVSDVLRILLYTIITFIATALLTVETPATGGYFNLGEAAIYVIAYLASPLVAAISSGLGPALADLALGYWYFAPATLVIKFCEGFIVSKLVRVLKVGTKRGLAIIIRVVALFMGLSLASIIILKLSFGGGATSIEVSWTPTYVFGFLVSIPQLKVGVPSYAWIAVALTFIAIVSLYVAVLHNKPYAVAMALGGLIMVTGYFLYEYFVSNPIILGRDPLGAIFEIPVNIGQFIAGVVLAYPVVQFIERARST